MNKQNGLSIDGTDVNILRELSIDAKMPLRKIASTLGVSFVTVMKRIKRMEKEGVIKGYVPRIDYEKLGYDLHASINIRISKGNKLEVEEVLAKMPNAYGVFDMTGDFDSRINCRFKSTRALDTFLKKIQKIEAIERTNTRLILNTIKDEQMRI